MERPILVLGWPVDRDGNPVDPGYGQGGGPTDPGFGNRPPTDPGYGRPGFAPARPGHDLPSNPGHPWLPGHGGGNSGHIDNSLPVPPAPPGLNPPPAQIWPPSAPIFSPGGPDNSLPPPGAIWPPLPPGMPEGELLVLVYITGLGWHWTVIDTSLTIDNTLPPTAAPK